MIQDANHASSHVLMACLESQPAATAMAFDHGGGCGIYNVATLEYARRRGLGTAVTAFQLHQAQARGARRPACSPLRKGINT
jgi:hypothetical protein